MCNSDQILHTDTFLHCQDTGMRNGDKGLLRISLAGRGLIYFQSIKIPLNQNKTTLYIDIQYRFIIDILKY